MGSRAPSTDDELEALRSEVIRLHAREEELTATVRRAEEELRASRAIHDATIESLPFDFWARDREGYCFSQNATARANWGDLLHKRPEDTAVASSVLENWLANNRRALSGELVRGDVQYVIHGETRHVQNFLAPIRMGDAIVGTLGVNVDITDLKRAEVERLHALQSLRESEEKLRMAVDAAGVGLWSWDLQTDEVSWEAPLRAIFGLPPGTTPVGRDGYLALVHPDDRARAAAGIADGVAKGRWEDEYRIVRADGAVRWVMVKGTVLNDHGRVVVLGALLDVSQRRQRDEEQRRAQRLEAVGQLTAGVAHNFNNLLMGMLSYLELAARVASPEVAPLVHGARESADRAATLVRQLMTYAGRNRPVARSVEAVGALVESVVALCRTTFDRRIAFELHCDPYACATMAAPLIEQSVLNVLINARDALGDPGLARPTVKVAVDVVRAESPELDGRARDHVRIRIADNGVGMDAATAARVFEPFFTTKEVGKGTGLGLATAYAIFREHEGWIACESVPGQGAMFSLYLPVDRGGVLRGATSSEPELATGGTETILVVDDEASIRHVLPLMLRSAGYTVMTVASGPQALDLLVDPGVAKEVALILLDVSMPGMPSLELRRRLRELVPRARVVYFTGHSFDATDTDDVVLEKPATQQQLLQTVRQTLDRRGPGGTRGRGGSN